MAKGGGGGGHWWDNQWENLPDEWSPTESQLFEDFVKGDTVMENDRILQALYDEALFNFELSSRDIHDIRETLKDYVWDEYGIDFDDIDVFDWIGYRENYDNVAS